MTLLTSETALDSDGSKAAVITALIRDANNNVMGDIAIAFSPDTGSLAVTQPAVTSANGPLEALPTPAQRAKAQLMTSVGGDEEDADDPDDLAGLATRGRAGAVPLTPAEMENLTDEDLFEVALRIVFESRKASVSYIQRRLKIGYARAGRLMDMMEERGIVGPYRGSRPREIIVDPAEYAAHGDEEDEGEDEDEAE